MAVTASRLATRPARTSFLPPYPRGPKPRRRTELGLLGFAGVLTVALYVVAELGAKSKIPPHLGPFLGLLFVLILGAHVANRWLAPDSTAVVLPVVALLNGIGYVEIVRWNPGLGRQQAVWTGVGVVVYVFTLLLVRRTRDLDRYRYILLLTAAVLILSPLFPVVGESVNGARLWVHFGHSQFQPVEIAKLLVCVFFASYFAEKKELLSIPTARLGNRLVLDPRPMVPILLACGFALLAIGAENDIGFALLIFTLFIVLLWLSTGRAGYLLFGIAMFAVAAVVAGHLFPQVHQRISIWLDPWKNPTAQGNGQLVQGWYSLGSGGIGGTGLGRGVSGYYVPFVTSDMILAGIGEEMGLLGTTVIVIAFLLVMGSGLRIAQAARNDFSRLMATGLTVILGFQALFVMAGVLRLLPFTGMTLPFVAYGGSSLVANYLLVALLLRISDEGSSSLAHPGDVPFVAAP